jgi:hypothetical protein
MVTTKKNFELIFSKILLYSYIGLYPFGQLLRIPITWPIQFTFQLIDLPVLLSIPLVIFYKIKKPLKFEKIIPILLTMVYSLLISPFIIRDSSLISYFYFFKLISYFTFFITVWNLINEEINNKHKQLFNRIIDLLIIDVLIISILGWLQYIYFPDLRALKYWGWDDHLYRLTSTLLDPGFTGIVIVLGIIATFYQYFLKRNFSYLLLIIFFILTLAFTYSRASYLAFIAGIICFIYLTQNKRLKKYILILTAIFLISLPILPKPGGEGVNLERTFSIFSRINQYKETLTIFRLSPVWGVGYNTLCSAKKQILTVDQNSHSCSGSDSSILFLLATSGIVGFLIILRIIFEFLKYLESYQYNAFLKISLIAVLVHSQFNNSLFYSWVIGWLAIISAGILSIKKHTEP